MSIQSRIDAAGELLWFTGSLVIVRVAAASNSAGMSVIENLLPFGLSPPLHVHRNQDEIFHVMDGTMRYRVDGRDVVAKAGDTLVAPKGVPHSFRVESAEGARVLTITQGRDFEAMVREVSVPAPVAELPPQGLPTPEQIGALVAACARNHIDVIGAPLS